MNTSETKLSKAVLDLDYQQEVDKTCARIIEIMRKDLHKRGLVVAMSGGIDSSVCTALAVKALGAKKVFGLILPEQDSSDDSRAKAEQLADHLSVKFLVHDIAPTLDAIGCYEWRDNAIRNVFPEYGEGWKNKIVISGGMEGKINHFDIVIESPSGERDRKRLPLPEYLQIVAATNYKQRIRKTIEYFHADRLNYAVVGTPNRLEYDQGFFVKNGDGAADIKPIAHLYKTQVYALARFMGLPEEICSARPTTDTYSLEQGQDEFYFALPYDSMDLALWAHNHNIPTSELAQVLQIEENQAGYIYKDIEAKRSTTRYLHSKAVLISDVSEIN